MADKKRFKEDYARAARVHWCDDEQLLMFFKRYMSSVPTQPAEIREMLHSPAWNAGFVTALVYIRSRSPEEPGRKGDPAILARVLETVLEHVKLIPHVTHN